MKSHRHVCYKKNSEDALPFREKDPMQKNITLSQGIKLNPEMVLNTLNFTLTVTLFAYPFKTDVGYSVWLTVDGK